MAFQALSTRYDTLKQEIDVLKAEDYIHYPADFVLDSSVSKGKQYYRKRDRNSDGTPGKSTQISAEAYAELKAELKRGKRIHKYSSK